MKKFIATVMVLVMIVSITVVIRAEDEYEYDMYTYIQESGLEPWAGLHAWVCYNGDDLFIDMILVGEDCAHENRVYVTIYDENMEVVDILLDCIIRDDVFDEDVVVLKNNIERFSDEDDCVDEYFVELW